MTVPHDAGAEAAALGAIWLRPTLADDVLAIALPDDFHQPAHAALARAFAELAQAKAPIDDASVETVLRRHEAWQTVGALEGLNAIGHRGSTHNALHHARRVRDMAAVRRTVDLARTLAEDGSGPDASANPIAWVEEAAHRLAEAGRVHRDDSGQSMGDLCRVLFTELQERKAGKHDGVKTGFPDIDTLTMGLRPGSLIVLGARPGIGKSAMATDIARNAAINRGIPVKFFSLEMTGSEVRDRILAAQSKVRMDSIMSGVLTQGELEMMHRDFSRVANANLHIDDSTGLPINVLTARARAWKRNKHQGGKHDLGLIVVDYVQLLTTMRRHHSREQEVAEFSGSLKNLAKDLRVPVLALAQLRREAENPSREPQMSDLRESGALEQDADVVILLHRPGARSDDPACPPGDAKAFVRKNRNGPTGPAELQYVGPYCTFHNTTRER